MQLAYSTNAFTRTDLRTALGAIADLGYTGIEILCDRPHWFPGEVDDREVDEIAMLLANRALSVSNLNANTAMGYYQPAPLESVFGPSLSHDNPELRRWRQQYTNATLRIAQRLGARCVSVTSGHPTPGVEPARSLDHLVDSLKRICDVAALLDVRVGIEYEPGLLVERASEVAEVLERVDSPHLGVNLDIGHSYLDGEAPEAAVALLAGRIWNVHVEDISRRKHFHLVPGDGDLPFERYFAALRKAGYGGFLTVELYTYPHAPEEAGRRALEFLRRTLG